MLDQIHRAAENEPTGGPMDISLYAKKGANLRTTWLAQNESKLRRAADAIANALKEGGKVLSFGNGGSAADAQHLTGELMGRFIKNRAPLAAVALSTDSSVITCTANDYS
jgi:D-sedoheptulose 7-phosphate isomerase